MVFEIPIPPRFKHGSERLGVRFPGATHLRVGFEHRDEAERFLEECGEL